MKKSKISYFIFLALSGLNNRLLSIRQIFLFIFKPVMITWISRGKPAHPSLQHGKPSKALG